MTALAALHSTTVRRQISLATHAHDETVKAFLRGFPTGRDEDLREAALAAGIDLATIPKLPAEVIAKRKEMRAPKCPRCRELEQKAWTTQDSLEGVVDLLERERRRYAKLRAFAAGLVQQLRDADEEFARYQREQETAGKRTVAAIDAQDAEAQARHYPAGTLATLTGDVQLVTPTHAPIPVRREPKPKERVVKLEGFPDDEPAVAREESGLSHLLSCVDDAAHG